jgi:hypothetical protein
MNRKNGPFLSSGARGPLEQLDIREKTVLQERDLLELNFIRNSPPVVFRRHFRAGLRSHLFEVLQPEEMRQEVHGIRIKGQLLFPRARPGKILRLFRNRFRNLEEALREIELVQLMIRFMGPGHVAQSQEFLVSYRHQGVEDILLCGLQEYISGEALNPWGPLDDQTLASLLERAPSPFSSPPAESLEERIRRAREDVGSFVGKVKQMISETNHIPDLAGVGNLILTPEGRLTLVDINNISPVFPGKQIYSDDHGYPVCDKSVEVLALLERKLLNAPSPEYDPLYAHFLDPDRMRFVSKMVRRFTRSPGKESEEMP